MLLEPCKDQPSRTLDEFYERVADRAGQAMLDLIARLRAVSDERRIWGLTSHERLCLLADNNSASPWYVIVAALDANNIFVEYRIPPEQAPWPNAHVRGEAKSLDDAVRMVLIRMDQSHGWT